MEKLHPFVIKKYLHDYIQKEHTEKFCKFKYDKPVIRMELSLRIVGMKKPNDKKLMHALFLIELFSAQKPCVKYIRFSTRLKKIKTSLVVFATLTLKKPKSFSFLVMWRRYLLFYYLSYIGYNFDVRAQENKVSFTLFKLNRLFSRSRSIFKKNDRVCVSFCFLKSSQKLTRVYMLSYLNLFGFDSTDYVLNLMHAYSRQWSI